MKRTDFTGTKPVEKPRVIITGGQPRTVEHIEKNQLADRMEVYNRDGDQFYVNEVKNKIWQKEPEALKEVEQAREVERKLEKSLDKQLEKAKPTKQKDVVRLPEKVEPQERGRDEDLSC